MPRVRDYVYIKTIIKRENLEEKFPGMDIEKEIKKFISSGYATEKDAYIIVSEVSEEIGVKVHPMFGWELAIRFMQLEKRNKEVWNELFEMRKVAESKSSLIKELQSQVMNYRKKLVEEMTKKESWIETSNVLTKERNESREMVNSLENRGFWSRFFNIPIK